MTEFFTIATKRILAKGGGDYRRNRAVCKLLSSGTNLKADFSLSCSAPGPSRSSKARPRRARVTYQLQQLPGLPFRLCRKYDAPHRAGPWVSLDPASAGSLSRVETPFCALSPDTVMPEKDAPQRMARETGGQEGLRIRPP